MSEDKKIKEIIEVEEQHKCLIQPIEEDAEPFGVIEIETIEIIDEGDEDVSSENK